MPTYLEDLTIRLAQGVGDLPERVRHKHSEYLKSTQQSDGGFVGREGGSDLYYTGFALRGLAISGELYGDVAQQAAEFLQGRLSGHESIIDFVSLLYGAALLDVSAGIDIFEKSSGDWRDAVAAALGKLRRGDGGYAKGEEGVASSTYHTFLVLLCLELIDRPLQDPERVVDFILSQQAEDGGFHEIRASKRAGTNPTAAAIGTLRTLGALDDQIREDTIDFLADMQTDEGGLRANTRIPFADLLSTFTGTLTLQDLGGIDQIDATAARNYAKSMEREEGGFHGAVLDDSHDVEYTFYGLGCLALLGNGP